MSESSFKSTLILAPSLAGKTTWVRSQPAAYVVDGDTVISQRGGWPEDSSWWRKPGAASVHRKHAAILGNYARNTGRVVAFNGDPSFLYEAFKIVIIVVPPLATLLERIARREVKGGFPNPDAVRENVRVILRLARMARLPIFQDFPSFHLEA